jgi:hypothetical protein
MNSSAKSGESPLAAEGGIPAPPRHDDDPYRTLDDLMVVVEALCPVWPPRDPFKPGGRMLL